MVKVNISIKNLNKFQGKWVAIDPIKKKIIAVGKTLKDISLLVAGKTTDPIKPQAYSFKVPRKDEGPYILIFK